MRIFSILGALIVAASIATAPFRQTSGGPILAGAEIDSKALGILQRSCQDCHSDNTYYPWYSYVAPASLLVKRDVTVGRGHMNLSHWQDYSLPRKERLLSEIANQVKDRDMPLPQYLLVHRNARLSDDDVKVLFGWTQAERSRLISSAAPQ